LKATNLLASLTAFTILFYSAVLLPKTNFILLQGNIKVVVILLMLCLFFLTNSFLKQSRHFSFSYFDVLFLSLITWQGISALWSINYIEAINVTFNWATLYIVFKFFQQFASTHQHKKYIIYSLVVACCTSLFFAYTTILYNIFSNQDIFLFDGSVDYLRKTYQLTKTYISQLFVLFLGVAVFLIVQKNEKKQWLGVLLFLLIFLIELLLQSRGGILLAALILFILSTLNLFLKSISWFKITSLIVSSIALFYVVSFLRTNPQDYLFIMDPLYGVKSSGGDDRLTMWKISYQLFLEKPLLGYGSGSWLYEYMRYDYCTFSKVNYSQHYKIQTHNLFIEKLAENGLPGFLLSVVFFILYPFWCLVQKLKSKTFNDFDYLWFTGVLCYAINAMLYSTLQIGWGNFKGQVFLYLLFLSQIIPKKVVTQSVFNKMLNYLIIGITIFALIFYANTSYLAHHFLKCSTYLKHNNVALAEKHLSYLELSPIQYLHKGVSTENLKMKLYLYKSQFQLAEASILKQLIQHPYNFNFWYELGNVLKQQYKFEQAKNAYEKALLFNCEYIPAQIKLLNMGFVLDDESIVTGLKKELSVIDVYLQEYQKNKARYKKISKAVKQKKVFQSFKAERDSILNAYSIQ